jgi:molecular chaperone GrpE
MVENPEQEGPIEENGMTLESSHPADTSDEAKEAYSRLHDQFLRIVADFDNYRKCVERDREQYVSSANEALVRNLLVIVDELGQAARSAADARDREGIEMLHKKLCRILGDAGLREIECLGKEFDPYLHEALCQEESDAESGTILEEFQKGYTFKSRVIRSSKVKIAEKKTECEEKNHG